jgi:hypothetical protein
LFWFASLLYPGKVNTFSGIYCPFVSLPLRIPCLIHMLISPLGCWFFGVWVFSPRFLLHVFLIGALWPLTFSVSIERCVVFPVIFIPLLFTFYLLLVYLSACSKWFILSHTFLFHSNFSSVCKSSLTIFQSTGLVLVNSFSFCLLWKFLISPSTRKDSFAG